MPNLVVAGAMMQCSFGASPCALIVLPAKKVLAATPAANINDHIPITNIPSFGMCSSLANPEVDTATTAAEGVLTPMPCVPVTSDPWAPGAETVLLGNFPALDNISTCMCDWGGEIAITQPGEETIQIP